MLGAGAVVLPRAPADAVFAPATYSYAYAHICTARRRAEPVNLWRSVVIVAGGFCRTDAVAAAAAAKPTGRVLARTAVEIDIVK